LTDNVFIEPLDLSQFNPSPSALDPGFAQLVHDTLGDSGSNLDSFEEVLTDAAGIVDALDKATAAQDAALDDVLVLLDTTNPEKLDGSMGGYASSFDAGNAVVSYAETVQPPFLGVLPLAMPGGQFAPSPPQQRGYDFGTLKLGGPAASFGIGRAVIIGNQYSGVENTALTPASSGVFSIAQEEKDSASGDQHFTFTLVCTPNILGAQIGQLEYDDSANRILVIVTLTVNVIA